MLVRHLPGPDRTTSALPGNPSRICTRMCRRTGFADRNHPHLWHPSRVAVLKSFHNSGKVLEEILQPYEWADKAVLRVWSFSSGLREARSGARRSACAPCSCRKHVLAQNSESPVRPSPPPPASHGPRRRAQRLRPRSAHWRSPGQPQCLPSGYETGFKTLYLLSRYPLDTPPLPPLP